MIDYKDIYSGKVKSGRFFVVTATREKVFVEDFVTVSSDKDGREMTALTNDRRFFSITQLDLCTE